jgi:hypothetical protein
VILLKMLDEVQPKLMTAEVSGVMERDKLLKRYPSPDGKRWIDLYERPDGLFIFRSFMRPATMFPVTGPRHLYHRDGNLTYTSASTPARATFEKWPPGFAKIQTEILPPPSLT